MFFTENVSSFPQGTIMAKLTEELWNILQELKEEEFKTFKWLLKQNDVLEGFSGIRPAQLEKADRQDTVDLIVQKYQDSGALRLTLTVLEKISRNDLVLCLQNISSLKGKLEEGKSTRTSKSC